MDADCELATGQREVGALLFDYFQLVLDVLLDVANGVLDVQARRPEEASVELKALDVFHDTLEIGLMVRGGRLIRRLFHHLLQLLRIFDLTK